MVHDILLILTAYALGCLSAGYYLVGWWAGEDIRTSGSGSAGATNVGRKMGAWAFSVTLLLDAAKAAAAAGLAAYFGFGPARVMLVILAVVAGHIWPLQLGFRGGKGIAPALGGIFVFDYRLGIIALLLCGIIFVFTRRLTLSGLLAAVFFPAVAWSMAYSGKTLLAISALVVVIVVSHRDNIRAIVRDTIGKASGKPHPSRQEEAP
jgi:glycerol-3-phosphate acyltransferase PlsY